MTRVRGSWGRRGAALIVSIAVLAGGHSAPAFAHAIVVESVPASGSKLGPGPQRVELRFNNRIDRQRSKVTLVGPLAEAGRPAPETPLPIFDSGPDDRLATELAPAGPGKYRLRWQVLALDGHITRGDVPFTVTAP